MNENNKSKPLNLWVPAVMVLAVFWAGTQAYTIFSRLDLYRQLAESGSMFILYRMIAFRVIGLGASLTILITIFFNRDSIILGTLTGYYLLYAALYFFGIFMPGNSLSAVVYFAFHIIPAIVLGLVLAKELPFMPAFISSLVLQITYLLFFLFLTRNSINWFSLVATMISGTLLLTVLCLVNEERQAA